LRGLILTGPLGVGKSTAQRRLILDHGFWTPETVTTRSVDEDELRMTHRTEATFIEQVRVGELVMPTRFGSQWYAWLREEVAMIRGTGGTAVLNVRPSTALTLAALLPDLIPIWLWVNDQVLTERRSARTLSRDLDESYRRLRETADDEDRAYRPLFARRAEANASLVPRLLEMLGP
jgi:guanylate kinase